MRCLATPAILCCWFFVAVDTDIGLYQFGSTAGLGSFSPDQSSLGLPPVQGAHVFVATSVKPPIFGFLGLCTRTVDTDAIGAVCTPGVLIPCGDLSGGGGGGIVPPISGVSASLSELLSFGLVATIVMTLSFTPRRPISIVY